MSAAEPAAEPSMEEILASIRKAISEDHSLSAEDGPDPFGADSPATSAFSNTKDGSVFDSAAHARHDPFAELNAKLEQQAQRQEQAASEEPAPPPAVDPAPPAVNAQPTKSVFDEIEEVFAQRRETTQPANPSEPAQPAAQEPAQKEPEPAQPEIKQSEPARELEPVQSAAQQPEPVREPEPEQPAAQQPEPAPPAALETKATAASEAAAMPEPKAEPLAAFVPVHAEVTTEEEPSSEPAPVELEEEPKPARAHAQENAGPTDTPPSSEPARAVSHQEESTPKAGDFRPFSDAFAAQKKKLSQTAFKAPEKRITETRPPEPRTAEARAEPTRSAPKTTNAQTPPTRPAPPVADQPRRETAFQSRIERQETSFSVRTEPQAPPRENSKPTGMSRDSQASSLRTPPRELSTRSFEREEPPIRTTRDTSFKRAEPETPRNTDFSARSRIRDHYREEPVRQAATEAVRPQIVTEVTEAMRAAAPVATNSSNELNAGSKTIEQFLQELLTPMLNEWLDRNLARIIEDVVRKEFEQSFHRRS